MNIDRLQIQGFRNIAQAQLSPHPNLNIITGQNGSGKTSVLESISLAAHGRSFRSHLSTPLIRHNAKTATVFANVVNAEQGTSIPIGVEKHVSKGTSIRVNRQKAKASSELARVLPLLVVDGDSFSLIDGASRYRRKLFDWLVFHVEHEFHPLWLGYYGALKQRNALLRRGILGDSQLALWTEKCVHYGEKLNQLRMEVLVGYLSKFHALNETFALDTTASFNPGWSNETTLAQCFTESLEGDVKRQTTKYGPHRADVSLRCEQGKVVDVYSRGQKKITVLALYIALIQSFIDSTQQKPLLLLDDLGAELDQRYLRLFLSVALASGSQVFITSIELDTITKVLPPETAYKVFHVEQGAITEQNP